MPYAITAVKLDEQGNKPDVSIVNVDVEINNDHDVEMMVRALLHNGHEVTIKPLPRKKKSKIDAEACGCTSPRPDYYHHPPMPQQAVEADNY